MVSTLLHLAKVLGDVELGASVLLDVLDGNIRSQLSQCQLALLPVHFEHTLVQKSAHIRISFILSFESKLTKSVMIVLTHLAPVNGSVAFCTIFGLPFLST